MKIKGCPYEFYNINSYFCWEDYELPRWFYDARWACFKECCKFSGNEEYMLYTYSEMYNQRRLGRKSHALDLICPTTTEQEQVLKNLEIVINEFNEAQKGNERYYA